MNTIWESPHRIASALALSVVLARLRLGPEAALAGTAAADRGRAHEHRS